MGRRLDTPLQQLIVHDLRPGFEIPGQIAGRLSPAQADRAADEPRHDCRPSPGRDHQQSRPCTCGPPTSSSSSALRYQIGDPGALQWQSVQRQEHSRSDDCWPPSAARDWNWKRAGRTPRRPSRRWPIWSRPSSTRMKTESTTEGRPARSRAMNVRDREPADRPAARGRLVQRPGRVGSETIDSGSRRSQERWHAASGHLDLCPRSDAHGRADAGPARHRRQPRNRARAGRGARPARHPAAARGRSRQRRSPRELERLDRGLEAAGREAEEAEGEARTRLGPQYADILAAHGRMIADPTLRARRPRPGRA